VVAHRLLIPYRLWLRHLKQGHCMLEYLTLQPQPVGSTLESALCTFLFDRESRRCIPRPSYNNVTPWEASFPF